MSVSAAQAHPAPDPAVRDATPRAGVVVLCGGFGAARFLDGLRAVVQEPVCVVNTADDLEYLGLRVCPDVDSVLYALAGCFDEERGWGVRGDMFRCNEALARFGDDWFHIGDADLATHLKRTALLRAGRTLSEAMAEITGAWSIRARVLPMSDERVRSVVHTDEGPMEFQAYVVGRAGRPRVTRLEYAGVEVARPAPGVLELLVSAPLVVLAPSNPVSSIGPILALPGVREALERRAGPTVAITPVVGSEPRTEAERGRARLREVLLGMRGLPHRPHAVAACYRDLIDGFVLDHRDLADQPRIEGLGVSVHVTDTLVLGESARAGLAAEVLDFASRLERASARLTSDS